MSNPSSWVTRLCWKTDSEEYDLLEQSCQCIWQLLLWTVATLQDMRVACVLYCGKLNQHGAAVILHMLSTSLADLTRKNIQMAALTIWYLVPMSRSRISHSGSCFCFICVECICIGLLHCKSDIKIIFLFQAECLVTVCLRCYGQNQSQALQDMPLHIVSVLVDYITE